MAGSKPPSTVYIFYQRLLRYVRATALLHLVSILGILLFCMLGPHAINAVFSPDLTWAELLVCFFSIYGLVLVLFSQADAKSRFQNYKQAKDLLYENGFDQRITRLFTGSRCQREAIKVAACDLGMTRKLNSYLKEKGFRFYHILPGFIFKRPGLLFTKKYWEKTLFEKTYESKYFLW